MGEESENKSDKIALTRRQALVAAGAGVAVLGATGLGVAYAGGQRCDAQIQQQQADLQQQQADVQKQVEDLKGLVKLYETLEQIRIDAIIAAGIAVLNGFFGTLKNGVALLGAAVTTIEGLLAAFKNTFTVIRAGLTAAEQAVSHISSLLQDAQNWLGRTTAPAQSVFAQVQQFFHDLISKIPFGVGDNILKTVDGLVGLVGAIPDAILQINTKLLEPLQTGWFSDDNTKNLQGTLIDPITHQLLDPLNKFLGDVNQTLAHWQSDMVDPVQTALNNRAAVQAQITDYKKQHNIA